MILKLENVSKAFKRSGEEIPALHNASLEVWPGEFIGIFGPSGAGKTTLLQIAAGLLRPDAGNVLYRRNRITDLRESELGYLRRRYVGCIWGTSSLQPGLTVLDNVAVRGLFPEPHRDGKSSVEFAKKLLARCWVDRCLDAYPHELSAGERKRVAIAQALAGTPQLLIGDELGSSLDMFERENVLSLLRSLAEDAKIGVLIAETDVMALVNAQTVIYLSQGILATGGAMQGLGDQMRDHVREADSIIHEDA